MSLGKVMSGKLDTEMLEKTIDRAIELARDLGRPMTVHILMMARIDLGQSKQAGRPSPHGEIPPTTN